jgi:hypothetical protein
VGGIANVSSKVRRHENYAAFVKRSSQAFENDLIVSTNFDPLLFDCLMEV